MTLESIESWWLISKVFSDLGFLEDVAKLMMESLVIWTQIYESTARFIPLGLWTCHDWMGLVKMCAAPRLWSLAISIKLLKTRLRNDELPTPNSTMSG